MMLKFPLDVKYNPEDTNLSNQLLKGDGLLFDLTVDPPPKDDFGNKWNNSQRKRRSTSTGSQRKQRRANINGWRDAVADSLDDVSGVFTNLKELTKADPRKFVILGGDAMIKKDDTAVIVEFNAWCGLNSRYYSALAKCLGGEEGCLGMFIQLSNDDDTNADNYIVTDPSPASHIAMMEGLAEVMKDMISMVMKVQPADEIGGLREVVDRNMGSYFDMMSNRLRAFLSYYMPLN